MDRVSEAGDRRRDRRPRARRHGRSLAPRVGGAGAAPGGGQADRQHATGFAPERSRRSRRRDRRASGPPNSDERSEEEWSGRRDSNPRPTAWKAVTLPLSYSRRGPFQNKQQCDRRSRQPEKRQAKRVEPRPAKPGARKTSKASRTATGEAGSPKNDKQSESNRDRRSREPENDKRSESNEAGSPRTTSKASRNRDTAKRVEPRPAKPGARERQAKRVEPRHGEAGSPRTTSEASRTATRRSREPENDKQSESNRDTAKPGARERQAKRVEPRPAKPGARERQAKRVEPRHGEAGSPRTTSEASRTATRRSREPENDKRSESNRDTAKPGARERQAKRVEPRHGEAGSPRTTSEASRTATGEAGSPRTTSEASRTATRRSREPENDKRSESNRDTAKPGARVTQTVVQCNKDGFVPSVADEASSLAVVRAAHAKSIRLTN